MYTLSPRESIVGLDFSSTDANTQFAVKLFSTELNLPGWQNIKFAEEVECLVAGNLAHEGGFSGPAGYGLVDADQGVIAAMAVYPRASVWRQTQPMGYYTDRIYTDILFYAKHPAYEHAYTLPKLLGEIASLALAQDNQTGIGVDGVLLKGDRHVPPSVWLEHGFVDYPDDNVPYMLPMKRVHEMAVAANSG